MSQDTILTDAAGNRYSLDNLSARRWLEGQSAGAMRMVSFLQARAGELFQQGKYEEAKALHTLAKKAGGTVATEVAKEVADHEREFPIEIKK